jgi:hypothetical protein
MPKNLGNVSLIASTAVFTLLVFQAFAVVPPRQQSLDRPVSEQLKIPQASHHSGRI